MLEEKNNVDSILNCVKGTQLVKVKMCCCFYGVNHTRKGEKGGEMS